MKLLFDFFPIVLFFITYKIYNIYAATVVAMGAAIFQVVFHKIKYNKFENMHLISLGFILVLGSATLFLHNEWFIKLKPTCIYWIFALVFLFSTFFGKKTVTQRLLEANLNLPERLWRRLNIAWSSFFIFLGIANLYVAYYFTTNIWVNFKLFGSAGLTLLFILIQSLYLSSHLNKKHNQRNVMLGMQKPPKE